MSSVAIRRFDEPDERRTFEKGLFELVRIAGLEIGRAEYEPGWRWSQHVGSASGESMCPVEHIGLVLSCRNRIRMEDGEEVELRPGDLFFIPPGHDSWVVGDERYVSLHLMGADRYAKK